MASGKCNFSEELGVRNEELGIEGHFVPNYIPSLNFTDGKP